MKRWERWVLGLLTLFVTVSGFGYLWMKHVLETDDPFAVVNHPWQGFMLAVHVAVSPGVVLMFGMLLNSHILRKLAAGTTPNRISGLTSLVTFGAMTVTGYLLQVVTNALLLRMLVATHIVSGLAFSLVYVAHLVISVRLSRVQAVRRAVPEAA